MVWHKSSNSRPQIARQADLRCFIHAQTLLHVREDVEDHGVIHVLSYLPRFVAGGGSVPLELAPASMVREEIPMTIEDDFLRLVSRQIRIRSTASIPRAPHRDWLYEDGPMKSAVVKRSVIVGGHKTSISIEDAFWGHLREIAHEQGWTLSKLIAEIDGSRQYSNLSSAIRVFVLEHFRAKTKFSRQLLPDQLSSARKSN
jgi:predicted DNA-binding ribbon-helix-helix protein